jgi:hypothetical protein
MIDFDLPDSTIRLRKRPPPKNVKPYTRPYIFWRSPMKLYLLFTVIDILILLAYPVVYVIHLIRRRMGVK